jgi:hypothetical protein
MKRTTILAALAALTMASPAKAEPLRLAQAVGPGLLPPYEVMTIVRSTGLDPLGSPMLRGPNYVLRAIDRRDREVRVVVNARSGDIVRVVPMDTASRAAPPPSYTLGPYERMDGPPPPPGYVAPEPRVYGAAPPVVDDEEDLPAADAPRPPAGVPDVPSARGAGPSSANQDIARRELGPPSEPHVITAIEPGQKGLLPPPPERFPQRVAPGAVAKPKPQIKREAAVMPKEPPLPRPRPANAIPAIQPDESAAAPAAAPPADPSSTVPN